MLDFTPILILIGRKDNNKFRPLGTGFLVSENGKVITARHVIGNETTNLIAIVSQISNIDEYQDLSDTSCNAVDAKIIDINTITDLCLLQTSLRFTGVLPPIESLDNIKVGDKVGMFGYPHCVNGRRVLTYQETVIGAKMLLETSRIKSKYATINMQTRPGQSGSLVFSLQTGAIIGLLIGTYALASGIIIDDINLQELNQTSYCISANYIKEML